MAAWSSELVTRSNTHKCIEFAFTRRSRAHYSHSHNARQLSTRYTGRVNEMRSTSHKIRFAQKTRRVGSICSAPCPRIRPYSLVRGKGTKLGKPLTFAPAHQLAVGKHRPARLTLCWCHSRRTRLRWLRKADGGLKTQQR